MPSQSTAFDRALMQILLLRIGARTGFTHRTLCMNQTTSGRRHYATNRIHNCQRGMQQQRQSCILATSSIASCPQYHRSIDLLGVPVLGRTKGPKTIPSSSSSSSSSILSSSSISRHYSSAAVAFPVGSSPFSEDPFGHNPFSNTIIQQGTTSRSSSLTPDNNNLKNNETTPLSSSTTAAAAATIIPPTTPTTAAPSVSSSSSSLSSLPTIELSMEQRFLLEKVVKEKKSIFFTGSAGTGKSVLLRSLITQLREKYKPGEIAVTASTGIAAWNVGGCTLHSFTGLGLARGDVKNLIERVLENRKARARWRKTKVLIIDEISMVDGEFFDKLEEIARSLRKNDKPFGGIQLIITGDFFQLPPVNSDNTTQVYGVDPEVEAVKTNSNPHFSKPTRLSSSDFGPSATGGRSTTRIIRKGDSTISTLDQDDFLDDWSSWYDDSADSNRHLPPLELTHPSDLPKAPSLCFDAKSWHSCIPITLQLTEVFRQRDPQFVQVLNEMRHGRLSRETCELLESLERSPCYPDDGIKATELFALRDQVDSANHEYLKALHGPMYIYEPQDSGPWAQWMDKVTPAATRLKLKENAQVMLIKNLSPTLVNGSMGTVVGFQTDRRQDEQSGEWYESKFPVVRFVGQEDDLIVKPEEWRMEMPNGEVIGSRVQIPLILAWAMSIHKSQGQTMSRVKVDMGKVFEPGQAYVALSRATSLAGLQVLNFNKRAVQAHERVAAFYDGLMTVRDFMTQQVALPAPKKRRARGTKGGVV